MDANAKRRKMLEDALALQHEFLSSGTHRGDGQAGGGQRRSSGRRGGGRGGRARGPASYTALTTRGSLLNPTPARPPPPLSRAEFGPPITPSNHQGYAAQSRFQRPGLVAPVPRSGQNIASRSVPAQAAAPAPRLAPIQVPPLATTPTADAIQQQVRSAKIKPSVGHDVTMDSDKYAAVQKSQEGLTNPSPTGNTWNPPVNLPLVSSYFAKNESGPATGGNNILGHRAHPPTPASRVDGEAVVMYYQDEAPRPIVRLPSNLGESTELYPKTQVHDAQYKELRDDSPTITYYQSESPPPTNNGLDTSNDDGITGAPAVIYYQEEYTRNQPVVPFAASQAPASTCTPSIPRNPASTHWASILGNIQHRAVKSGSDTVPSYQGSDSGSLMDVDTEEEVAGYPVLSPTGPLSPTVVQPLKPVQPITAEKCTCIKQLPALKGLGTSRWAVPDVPVIETGMFAHVVGKETDPTFIGCSVHHPKKVRVPAVSSPGNNGTLASQGTPLIPTAPAFVPRAPQKPTSQDVSMADTPDPVPEKRDADVFLGFTAKTLGGGSAGVETPWLL